MTSDTYAPLDARRPNADANVSTDYDMPLEGEAESYANPDSTSVYPNAKVRVDKDQFTTSHLHKLVEKRGVIKLDPEFQRHNVWTLTRKRELIESILMGIPIPVIYLFENTDGTRQVVDGKQRISTIIEFLNNSFSLADLKILPNVTGTFDEIDPKLQGVFEDYQLSFYIIQPPTPERVKYDIFDRVNRGGMQLNHQEMRNALYQGRATRLLKKLVKSPEFLDATDRGISPKRLKDQYLALRAIAFMLIRRYPDEVVRHNGQPIEYKSDIDDFLAKIMVFLNKKAPDSLIEQCGRSFLQAMTYALEYLGPDAFRFNPKQNGMRRPVNMPLFEMITYILSYSGIRSKIDRVAGEIRKFKELYDSKPMFMSNVDSSTNVNLRFDIAENLLK